MPPRRRSKPRSPEHGALGDAVLQLRLESGLSQEALAEKMGTDVGHFGEIERGTGNPNYATLIRLAAALDTKLGVIANLADSFLEEAVGAAQPAESD
jgi:transcriptional regulator with XRE-family HTH domain